MPETFLILLAGGIMLAAAISNPRDVTLQWLRLCGILSLSMAALSIFFMSRPDAVASTGLVAVIAAVLGQLAFGQLAWRRMQRIFAAIAFVVAVGVGVELTRPLKASAWQDLVTCAASSIGIAAMTGLVLMDMLLGHAYLTASKMTIAPFRRLNSFLGGVLVWRAISTIGAVIILQHYRPIYMLWGAYGLFMLTRWLVGLGVPAAFIYMAHDCIKRRSTQSATGILYVAGVLVFIGEIIALYLVRATGLPF